MGRYIKIHLAFFAASTLCRNALSLIRQQGTHFNLSRVIYSGADCGWQIQLCCGQATRRGARQAAQRGFAGRGRDGARASGGASFVVRQRQRAGAGRAFVGRLYGPGRGRRRLMLGIATKPNRNCECKCMY